MNKPIAFAIAANLSWLRYVELYDEALRQLFQQLFATDRFYN